MAKSKRKRTPKSVLKLPDRANGMRDGYAGTVPAGSHFGSDAGWLETQVLSRK